MPFLFLGLFIIFLSVISLYRKRHDRRQNEVEENFWVRESEANHVRRKDISELPYITIPFDSFSIGSFPDDALSELETELTAFGDKKMLNLAGKTNTDLKLLYGPANLTALTEYDNNYVEMLKLLNQYADRLIELNHIDAAVPVLEFAISTGSDFTSHYMTLAVYYRSHQMPDKLVWLKTQAEALPTLMRNSIVKKLTEFSEAE